MAYFPRAKKPGRTARGMDTRAPTPPVPAPRQDGGRAADAFALPAAPTVHPAMSAVAPMRSAITKPLQSATTAIFDPVVVMVLAMVDHSTLGVAREGPAGRSVV
jgi:hypothetical protein